MHDLCPVPSSPVRVTHPPVCWDGSFFDLPEEGPFGPHLTKPGIPPYSQILRLILPLPRPA